MSDNNDNSCVTARRRDRQAVPRHKPFGILSARRSAGEPSAGYGTEQVRRLSNRRCAPTPTLSGVGIAGAGSASASSRLVSSRLYASTCSMQRHSKHNKVDDGCCCAFGAATKGLCLRRLRFRSLMSTKNSRWAIWPMAGRDDHMLSSPCINLGYCKQGKQVLVLFLV